MPLAPGVLLKNRYRISRFLAQGQSGAVYQAWDTQLKRNCAIKENFDISLGNRQRFDRLAAQLMDLDHPGLPQVWDAFLQPGSGLYLVMAYIEGNDLRQMMLARGGPLPEAQALDWISQVCDALAYLHKQIPPLYHTDIKPANIRITPEGQAILVDLGTLRAPDAETHGATELGIHAAFIAPEVADQGAWDEQSDIYALGVTLFTLLTGKPPSEADKRTPGFARRLGISPRVGLLIERSMRGDKAVRLENVHDFRKILVEASAPRTETLAIPSALKLGDQAEKNLQAEINLPMQVETAAQASLRRRLPWSALLLVMSALLVLAGIFVVRPPALFGGVAQPEASATPAVSLIAQIATRTSVSSPTPEPLTATPTSGGSQPTLTFTPGTSTQPVLETLLPTLTPTPAPLPTPLTAPDGFYFFTGHETGVFSVAYSPDGNFVASGSADGQIILWDARTGAVLRTLQGHTEGVNTLTFSPDSLSLASGSVDKTVILWNVGSGENIHVLTAHRKAISDIVFSPDGLILACTSQDSTITVWNAQNGELLKTLVANVSKDLPAGFTSLAFSPGGALLAVGSSKGVVFWDTSLWAELRTVSSNVLSLAYAPDGESMALGLVTGGVALWDTGTNRLIYTLQKHIRPVTGVAFSTDGKLMASVSRDGLIVLWDVAQRSILRILEGHSDAVTDLAFSPDGKLLVTASVDGTVILWAVPIEVASP